ncbi:hypothetical protein [Paenibacillus selenitireducens]|nr:hypothetical protein [Paenibacillus selenitireducens]
MMWGQGELFALASKEEVQRTKFLLEKYKSMMSLIQDFEKHQADLAQVAVDGEVARRIDNEEYYANKTANAVILMEKQKWVYEEYKFYTYMLRRAHAIIEEHEEREAVELRYFNGFSPQKTYHHLRKLGWSERTIGRRIDSGIESMANSLKIMGFFERKSDF